MHALTGILAIVLAAAPAAAEPTAATESTVTVTLHETAMVDGAQVTLADVARVAGEPALLATKVAAVALGPAPTPGMERSVTRRSLISRLRQERIDTSAVTWAGALTTRVGRRSSRVPGAVIGQAGADALRSQLPWPDEDLVIEVQRPPADLHIIGPTAGLRYAVAVRPGQRLLGSVPVHVTIERDGRAVGRATAVLTVRVFQRMLVARRRIRRGEVLTKDMVRLQRGELTSMNNDSITDLADALGREARVDILAFAVVTRQTLTAARVVRRGALVTLLARRGSLRISAHGIAEQDGAAGQLIRVRNRDSQRLVYGRVVDAQTVAVPF